ncbi:hypothetical protein D3C72_514560 [compost metagenome]
MRHRGDGAGAWRHAGRQTGGAADAGDGEVATAPADRGGHLLGAAIGQGRHGIELLGACDSNRGGWRGHHQVGHDRVSHGQGRAARLGAGAIGGRDVGTAHAHPGRQPADDGGHPGSIAAPAGGAGDVLGRIVRQAGEGGELLGQPDRHRGRIGCDLHLHHGGIAHRQRGTIAQIETIDAAGGGDIGRALHHPGRHAGAAVDGGNAAVVAAPADIVVTGHLLTGAIRQPGTYRERLAQASRHRLDARAHLQAGHFGAGHGQGGAAADGYAIDDGGRTDIGGTHLHPDCLP